MGEDYVYHGSTNFKGIHKFDTLQLSTKQKSLYKTGEIAKLYPEYYIIKVNQFNLGLAETKDTLDEWIYFLKPKR